MIAARQFGTLIGDCLLTLHSEEHTSSKGAGESGEERVVKTLQPQG